MSETKDAKGNPIALHDVVQITDSTHQWFPALLIVTELKGWGVMAYLWVVNNGSEPNGQAFIRPKSEAIEVVGRALIVDRENEDE